MNGFKIIAKYNRQVKNKSEAAAQSFLNLTDSACYEIHIHIQNIQNAYSLIYVCIHIHTSEIT